jgi:hypothetical protein
VGEDVALDVMQLVQRHAVGLVDAFLDTPMAFFKFAEVFAPLLTGAL